MQHRRGEWLHRVPSAIRQKQRFADLGNRLRALGRKSGLGGRPSSLADIVEKEAHPTTTQLQPRFTGRDGEA